ncbi:MAG: winged helix-turn-helix transcriptional regulator [Methylococcales bacterium]|nr:winged helix-turn-helix transcriptional regulator [Methylococcales bacterium]
MNKLSVLKLISCISNLLRSEERKIYTLLNLQPIHGQILDYLSKCNLHSDTPASVTAFLDLTKGTVSQSLQILERKGYIKKVPDKNDHRVVHLKLLPAGHRILDKIQLPDIFKQVESQIAEQDFSSLADALKNTLLALQTANNSRTFGLCNTCIYFVEQVDNQYYCGLTSQALKHAEIDKICKEHILEKTI